MLSYKLSMYDAMVSATVIVHILHYNTQQPYLVLVVYSSTTLN